MRNPTTLIYSTYLELVKTIKDNASGDFTGKQIAFEAYLSIMDNLKEPFKTKVDFAMFGIDYDKFADTKDLKLGDSKLLGLKENVMEFRINGRIIKPSGGTFKCENCGEKTRMMREYLDKDGNQVVRCRSCDEIKGMIN